MRISWVGATLKRPSPVGDFSARSFASAAAPSPPPRVPLQRLLQLDLEAVGDLLRVLGGDREAPAHGSGLSGLDLRVVAVPLEGTDQAVAQLDRRRASRSARAASSSRRTGGRSRPPGCRRRGIRARGRAPRDRGDRLQHLAHRVRALAAGVEGLPRRRPAGADRVLDRQVGGDRVVDVEEVALGAAVGADRGRRPSSTAAIASGIRREKLRSPPP